MQFLTYSDKQKLWLVKPVREKYYLGISTKNKITITRYSLVRILAQLVSFPVQNRRLTALIVTDNKDWKINSMSPFSMHLINGKDEICYENQRLYFAPGKGQEEIYAAHGNGKSISCIRCKTAIETGHIIIRCPECSRVYHESADLNCWSYDSKCLLCGTETTPDLSWIPN